MSEIIVALDVDSAEFALKICDLLSPDLKWVKVGMELYYSAGGELISEIKKRNLKIFLDLKIHDIPNTAKSAIKSINKYSVDMTNLHCAGGFEMMKEAKSVFAGANLIGVTQLTSTSEEVLNSELLINKTMEETVLHYARMAKEAGLQGVVCSALEAKMLKSKLGNEFKTICPGIRFDDEEIDDQKRVLSPRKAKELGADFLVMGRSITRSSDPHKQLQRAIKEIS